MGAWHWVVGIKKIQPEPTSWVALDLKIRSEFSIMSCSASHKKTSPESSKDVAQNWQPRYPSFLFKGRWLCVLPFRIVCLEQPSELSLIDELFQAYLTGRITVKTRMKFLPTPHRPLVPTKSTCFASWVVMTIFLDEGVKLIPSCFRATGKKSAPALAV